jgi:hypothetical protein
MSELELIQSTVAATSRRRRWQNAWHGLWTALFIGSCSWLLALLLYKILPLPDIILSLTGLLALLAVPFGFILGGLRRPPMPETARWLDSKLHLQERLGTALELASVDTCGRWRDLVLTDAASHARSFDLRATLPHQLPRVTRWALLTLALAVGLGFAPEYRTQRHQQQRLHASVMRDTGQRLDELVRRQIEQRPPALESTRHSLDAVQDLATQLTKANLTRTDALRELASVTDRLREETRELGRNPALRRLDEAARSPGGQGANSISDLQRQIQNLQQQLGQPAATPSALDQLKNELNDLHQAAASLPDAGSPEGLAARQQLANSMASLAQKAAELGLSLPNLDEAIKALDAGQIDQLLRDLEFAEIDLDQMSKLAKALENLQMQLAEIGKDLAEQLEKGQALPAIASLNKIIRQLEQNQLSQENFDALLDEVRRAVTPGNDYGQVGELLAQAASQMQEGNRAEAGKSLGDAADELRRLLQQLNDAQGLMAALEGLQTAQMCIGNGLTWGLCRSQVPGFSPGSKPGRGVGTWGDDGNWIDNVENTGLWDNSGIERPDFDPRGLSNRGEPQRPDGLTPTRVRGQISPGGSMPSITLRGLSIRGESRVSYQEAVASAQDDAQSALSQDRVPRAYQSAVRDYFDDLKD